MVHRSRPFPTPRHRLLGWTALTLAPLAFQNAAAGPAGASYDPAEISVTRSGATTTVTQSTDRAVIDWQSFDVGRNESVHFAQPGVSSSTLNRVHAGRESTIAGRIIAPGQVIIQNSNGVVFTETARIDVGSLVATSVGISARNFTEGKLVFDQPGHPRARVRNEGQISVAEKGLAAFVAPGVANAGVIAAKAGTVVMAAGQAATIDLYGDGLVSVVVTDPATGRPAGMDALVEQGGVIRAEGGTVILTAEAAAGVVNSAINMTGLIQARGVSTDGGKVALVSASGGVGVAGRIDASSDIADAGSVQVAGTSVAIEKGTEIAADAATTGSGGTVSAIASNDLRLDGTISAKSAGGNGGKVNTSAKAGGLSVGSTASVSVAAPAGTPGHWLIDPATLTVVQSGGNGDSTVDANVIEAALAGGSVTLQATDLIDIQAEIAPTSLGGNPAGLQLIADGTNGRVRIAAPIRIVGGNLAVRATRGIDLVGNAVIDTGPGTVWLQTSTTGTITQSTDSAILAGALGLYAADISLGSFNNNVGTLAGMAVNGGFRFNQTNAGGITNVGTVADPFISQSVAGVTARTVTTEGNQIIEASTRDGTVTITLSAGGADFNSLVFSALPYGAIGDPAALPDYDSSDYFVQALTYALAGGGTVTVRPDSAGKPAGFIVTANFGSVVVDDNRWGVAGLTSPGPTVPNELQYDFVNGTSETLTFALGGTTGAVDVTLSLFYRPDRAGTSFERGQVTFLNSAAGVPQIETRQLPGAVVAAIAAFNLVEPPVTGRDPDTPGDAVFRTTPLENPFVEDPYALGYSLGSIDIPVAAMTPEQLAQIPTAAGASAEPQPFVETSPQSRRSGQHARRPVAGSLDFTPVNLGDETQMNAALEAALANIVTAAGPGAGIAPAAPAPVTGCSTGSFLADFWSCGPTSGAPAVARRR